jgi:hypothetical protein
VPITGESLPCGGKFAIKSLGDKVYYSGCANQMLLFIGASALAVLVVQSWTKAKPLPYVLVFPAPEILVSGLLVMPLGLASTTLLVQVGNAWGQALGALAMAVLLAYLGFIWTVLLSVSVQKEALGLRYIKHTERAHTVRQHDGGSEAPGPQHDQQDSTTTTPIARSSTSMPRHAASTDLPGDSSMRGLLQRVAPAHSAGYWEKPDVVQQQELRRTYQGECLDATPCFGAYSIQLCSLKPSRHAHPCFSGPLANATLQACGAPCALFSATSANMPVAGRWWSKKRR